MEFFATVPKGIEVLTAAEIGSCGTAKAEAGRGGVRFEGTLETAYRARLWSRTASRILMPVKTFDAPSPEKLYGGVKSIRWTDHLDPAGTIAIDFVTVCSKITHSHFGALKSKDAIVDQLRSVTGVRPSVDVMAPDVRINIHLHNDVATVSIDLSGASLHRRGYREDGAMAPLKENLAASMLLLAGWPEVFAGGGTLFDPMCGSGTILVEGAMMAAGIAPGIGRRRFGFEGWRGHDAAVWKKILMEAKDRANAETSAAPAICGSDISGLSLKAARMNAASARVDDMIKISKKDFLDAAPPARSKPGIIVMNPPYGERLGADEDLRPLYKTIGDVFKQRFGGWRALVLSGNQELSKCIGLKTKRKHVLFNGAIECRLLEYELY